MALRVRHIQLRAQTVGGLYGSDVALDGGLTIIHAPNTSGKSTLMQALLYALGLEQMLSPKREIPLPYAMQRYVEDPESGIAHNVLESFVAVELENADGTRMVVRRNVVSDRDRRLITVVEGADLTEPSGQYPTRDYFVLDPGAAQRDAGFHRLLADFIGWSLPRVKRYDGTDTILYVETIFPLFYVEQKAGWSSIPAAIPTHFQIRDVAKRSVEFLLALETHELELRRQELELRLNVQRAQWSASVGEIEALASTLGMRIQQLPTSPTSLAGDVRAAHLQVATDGVWIALDVHVALLQEELDHFDSVRIPEVEEMASEAALEVDRLTMEIQTINNERGDIFRARQSEIAQRQATLNRIQQIEEDLKKNQDALKLQRYGSSAGHDLSPEFCPTCEQSVADALLPQDALQALMSLDDNIEFLQAQRIIFKRLVGRSDAVINELDLDLLSTADDVRQRSARLRALKADLIAPSHDASASFIEQRVRLDARIQRLVSARERFDSLVAHLLLQVEEYGELLAARTELPASRFSEADRAKLDAFQTSIRSQLASYGFTTFAPAELEVSEDTYRPQKEGFEIGFELSASDAIRLKWAYQMGLLDVAARMGTHHPGMLILDEPRQQEAAEASVGGLLRRSADLGQKGLQVVIATSEHLPSVQEFVSDVPCQLVIFDGKIIRKLN